MLFNVTYSKTRYLMKTGKFLSSIFVVTILLGLQSCTNKLIKSNQYRLNSAIIDQTEEIQNFINTHDTTYLPAGTYIITQIKISSNKTILTDGFVTKLKQLPSPVGTPVMLVMGENIKIDSISVEGSIETDQGEWSHGLAIMSKTKTTKNVEIKGLHAKNIRGDGLYIGTLDALSNCKNIIANNIEVENCLRNGVSVVTGENIYINNVIVKGAGLFGIDIEGDPPKIPLRNITVSDVVGPCIGIIGGGEVASNITFKNVKANGIFAGSKPAYQHKVNSGVVVRNASSVTFENLDIQNFEKFAIDFVFERTDKINEKITIKNLTIKDVSLKENIYNAYILTTGVKYFSIDTLNAEIGNGKSLFLGNDAKIESDEQTVDIKNAVTNGGYFARYTKILGDNLTLINCEYCFQKLHKGSTIKNSKLSGIVINSLSTDTHFFNTTVKFSKSKFENCQKQFETNVKELKE